mgnify:CR=1 FL=1
MSNDNRTNIKAHHRQHSDKQPSKGKLLANFIKFMAWVIVIGLVLSPLACTIQISDDTNKQQGGDYE